MATFTELSAEQAAAYKQLEIYRKQWAAINLRRITAASTIMLVDAITTSLDPHKAEDLPHLAALTEKKAAAYGDFARQRGAHSWVTYKLLKAFDKLNLEGGG